MTKPANPYLLDMIKLRKAREYELTFIEKCENIYKVDPYKLKECLDWCLMCNDSLTDKECEALDYWHRWIGYDTLERDNHGQQRYRSDFIHNNLITNPK